MTDIELYNKAKEAYYNGQPIMEDFEFDELEEKLGLSNKSYVGTRHNPSYTIKHPFIMGSLSKIQIKKGKDGNVDWDEYLNQLRKYVGDNPCIITPKYDGCSFEVIADGNKVVSISSRGDGTYGKDFYRHLIDKVQKDVDMISAGLIGATTFRLAGEVLIDKYTFSRKYGEFVNPRSFVSGVLNREYDENDREFLDMVNDLSIVIYDVRRKFGDNWYESEWTDFNYINRPQEYLFYEEHLCGDELRETYDRFEYYRNNKCPFALDGIVFKPILRYRENSIGETRPKDCVAIKFIPQLQETEITDIKWEQGKTGELFPVVITKPVIMDGKTITRVSGHNWGYLVKNSVNIGAKIIMSLAGDIIPFIYKVTEPSDNLEVLDTVPYDRKELEIHGCHLMKVMSVEEKNRLSFISSAESLEIPGIGPSAINTIYDYLMKPEDADINDFFGNPVTKTAPFNILLVKSVDIENALGGKLGKNAKKEFDKVLTQITLKDIIKSCSFRFCGDRMSEQVANYMLDLPYDWTSMASEGYSWVFDLESEQYWKVMYIIGALNKTLEDFKNNTAMTTRTNTSEQIPVILTGEPTNYKTKAEFLQCHPEYRNTTSWKEVKIVFTNSLDSNTGKMKKAKEKGIEIRLY